MPGRKNKMTRDVAEALVLQDYREHYGKLLRVSYLAGTDKNGDSIDKYVDGVLIVRLLDTNEDSVLHWNDEWLDPYWDVEVIQGAELVVGINNPWIDGPSYNTKTGEREWKGVTPIVF